MTLIKSINLAKEEKTNQRQPYFNHRDRINHMWLWKKSRPKKKGERQRENELLLSLIFSKKKSWEWSGSFTVQEPPAHLISSFFIIFLVSILTFFLQFILIFFLKIILVSSIITKSIESSQDKSQLS
jgi:hypothetical protein